jgi:hypothetical protein
MPHLVPGFQRSASGRIVHRQFDGDEWPVDGWFDSPDKVPGSLPGQQIGQDRVDPAPEILAMPKPYGAYGTVYGEKTQEQKAHEQAIAAPRKNNGRFTKGKRR